MINDLLSSEALQEAWRIIESEFLTAIWETVYVTLLATAFSILIGLPLGVLLVVGEKDGVLPLPKQLLQALNIVINLLRSIPFLILMILVFPLTRWIVGTVVGTTASIVPLVIAAFVVVILSTTMSFTILANHHGTAFTTKELRCQQILFCCLEAWRRKSVMRFTLLHSVE